MSQQDLQKAPAVSAGQARYRELARPLRFIFYLFSGLSVLLAVDYLFSLGIGGFFPSEWQYYFLLIGLILPWVFLFLPFRKGRVGKIPWYDFTAALLVCGISIYFSLHALEMQFGLWSMYPSLLNLTLAIILNILVLESARRTGGPIFFVVCLVFATYPLIAPHMPGVLMGAIFEFPTLIGHLTFDCEGLLGIPMKVVGGILIGFLVFAGLLIRTGAGDFFLNLAMAVAGHTRGGAAKVAVIGSAFFGSLSGSIFSNIVGTGSITIPAMKQTGYPAHYAGAVEACSSTGGVLMPPVMGAAAFVMATFTDIPYATICVAAFIPSCLYYLGLLLQVDAYAARTGLKGLPREQLPKFWPTLKQGWHFVFVLIFLVWGLVYMRWAALTPFYASALLILLAMIRKDTRINKERLISLFEGVGKLLTESLGIILPLGLIVCGLVITGVAPAFTSGIIALSGGIPWVALLFGAVACYILGLVGMLTPAYIFLAMSLAPVLVMVGFNVLAVHLFIIYYAMLSAITPPVAAGAFLASNIAGAPPMKTAFQAMRLGVVIYFVPFFFVFEPAFVLQGTLIDSLFYIPTCALGIVFLTGGIEGYLLGVGRASNLVRPLLIIAGCLIAFPDWKSKVIGVCLAIPVVIFMLSRRRVLEKSPPTP